MTARPQWNTASRDGLHRVSGQRDAERTPTSGLSSTCIITAAVWKASNRELQRGVSSRVLASSTLWAMAVSRQLAFTAMPRHQGREAKRVLDTGARCICVPHPHRV
jgi:hypothetical protein